jgi:hypothetical protein
VIPSMSAHREDAEPPDDLVKDAGPSSQRELGEHRALFVLSFSTMIYALVKAVSPHDQPGVVPIAPDYGPDLMRKRSRAQRAGNRCPRVGR